jgi:hypothetical protein
MSSWAERNKEHIREYQRQYRLKNREKRLAQKKEWCKNNKERQRSNLRRRHVARMSSDPLYKLERNLRKRLAMAIKKHSKTGSAVRDLGCSIDELKQHLESKFLPGMTWNNYGRFGWHIDHIRPLSQFDLTNPEQLKIACHYTNLQPLWWRDNLSKGDTYG